MGHADGAPAYKSCAPGQLHDSVRHSQSKGRKPEYAKAVVHADENGNSYGSVAGTQSLDGWWGHGKRATRGVNARYEDKVDDHFREEQWRHWMGDADRWVEAGHVISWVPQ